ncbi:MAG: bifunctional [glutamine synthetase] adenylyltransferase/[glutamine synthetase]-adenylyl-L-tyrosine phosphorylase [Pseudomonadota bacterium]
MTHLRPLAARLDQARFPIDPSPSGDDPFASLQRGCSAASPYLARLIDREEAWLAEIAEVSPEETIKGLIGSIRALSDTSKDMKSLSRDLHLAKARASLLVALADLGGVWSLVEVTNALSDFADAATDASLKWLLSRELTAGKLPGLGPDALESGAGFIVIAMGKHGARELNYSSDIDLICLFDQSRFAPDDFADAKSRYIRITRDLVKLLSENTEHGYVFRTDLRLRPSPSTTPVCMAVEAAERYYESVGRTWERAAHIKARACAGDIAAGEAYLDRLTPFVWRRYLDFAAIDETADMLRKIRETKGRFVQAEIPGADVKVSPGGIREIEFFAQTRQLIQGGRNPTLRDPTTLGALSALAGSGIIPAETADQLSADYIAHRTLEHRLQMIEDARTHTVPLSKDGRTRVAALMGEADLSKWEEQIGERMGRVHSLAQDFFGSRKMEPEARFEEVSAADLEAMGFQRPEDMCRLFARWRTGQIPATRDARSLDMYRRLEGRIRGLLAEGGQPDQAALDFDRFLSGLPSGVQVFALFTSNPHLLDLIVRICSRAPRLAVHLGQNPQVLDSLLDQSFFEPVPGSEALSQELTSALSRERDYERKLDVTRRWARDLQFRAGVQLLFEMSGAEEAAAAFTAIAEASIQALLPHVIAEFAAKHGAPPGRGLAVIAMGKLGSCEMTARSDLDLITVYDSAGADLSDGPKPLPPISYFPRLTQALVAALTAPTAEGRLYEVDMRLRPSGRMGPVAVSLEGFERYQRNDAWVWEHMALTRARVIAGDPSLADEIEAIRTQVLAERAARPEVLAEAKEMRNRISSARTAEEGEVWSLKGAPGGLLEIEFLAQTGVLHQGLNQWRRARPAFADLAGTGWLPAEEAAQLTATHALLQQMQQIERVALDRPLDPGEIGSGLLERLLTLADAENADDLKSRLAEAQSTAADIIARRFATF